MKRKLNTLILLAVLGIIALSGIFYYVNAPIGLSSDIGRVNKISNTAPYWNKKAYKKEYLVKREKKMKGIGRADGPDEWAKIQIQRRTPEDLEAPSYPANYLASEYEKALRNRSVARSRNDATFTSQGPANVGGRTRAMLVDPRDETGNTWILASATGGTWKTSDGGQNWENLTADLPNISASALAFVPSQPDIMYLGTGEYFTNTDGAGVFKTVDGGETWTQVANPEDYPNFRSVSRIIVNPDNPDHVLASAVGTVWDRDAGGFRNGAIFLSEDGGASWEEVYTIEFESIDDLDFNPENFNTIYGCVSSRGIVKSTDGGKTWREISIDEDQLYLTFVGRIEMDISPIDTNRIWLSVSPGNLVYSNDAGESWEIAVTKYEDQGFVNYLVQGFYDNAIAAHPFELNSVYIGGVDLFRFDLDTTQVDSVQVISDRITPIDSFDRYFLEGEVDYGGFPVEDVEVRFGQGSQFAHRFIAEGDYDPKLLSSEDGLVYQDFVEVPFQVWTVGEQETQLAIVFVDCNEDSMYTVFGPGGSCEVEDIIIAGVPYQESEDSFIIDKRLFDIFLAGHSFFTGNTGPGEEVALEQLPEITFTLTVTNEAEFIANALVISDAYSQFNGNNNFGFDNLISGQGNHPDQHHIIAQVVDANTESFRMLVCNDGGIYTTEAGTNPGETDGSFAFAATGFVTSQFYGADKAPGSDRFIGGTQDNGTWFMPDEQENGEGNQYTFGIGGDGFEVIWNQRDPDWIIGGSQFNGFSYTRDGGQTWQVPNNANELRDFAPFISRLTNHASNPERLYSVTEAGVWISKNFGLDWTLTEVNTIEWFAGFTGAIDIEASLASPEIIWSGGVHGGFGRIHVSQDGGRTFTPTNNYEGSILGFVSGIATHPHNQNTAYALFSFADRPKVLRTNDLGDTWEDISGYDDSLSTDGRGFPDVATNCLFVFPNDTNRIWVGTEVGIVESLDNGQSWSILEGELGAANVHQIVLRDDKLVIATYGRGIWTAEVEGVEAERPVLVPFVSEVVWAMLEESHIATIRFSDAFDSTIVVVNDSIIASPEILEAQDLELNIPTAILNEGENVIRAVGYLDGIAYESSEFIYEPFTPLATLTEYATSFDSVSRDIEFRSEGLMIRNESEWEGRSLQSLHPYLTLSNATAILRHPIRIEDQILSYRDIALVEPGIDGAEVGSESFFDYVAVEASVDGINWEILNAYDASYDTAWLQAYETSFFPDSTLFRKHEIVLNDYFEREEVILIRFRLFSDPGATGWGWTVEDLEIKPPVSVSVNPVTSRDESLTVYPNPLSNGLLNVQLDNGSIREVRIFDIQGREVLNREVTLEKTSEIQLNMDELSTGTYFLKVMSHSGYEVTKPIILAR